MNAVEYTYRIFANNVAGASEWTSASALTLANRPEKPSVPLLLDPDSPDTSAVAGPGEITYAWQAPVFNGGSPIISYEYRYQVALSNSWTRLMDNGTKLTVKIEELDPAKTYDFEVSAVNSVASSDPLKIMGVSPNNTPPTAAPTVSALASEDANSVDQVTLSWTGLASAYYGGETTLSDPAYAIQRKLSTASWPKADNEEGNTAANRTSVTPSSSGGPQGLFTALDGGDRWP